MAKRLFRSPAFHLESLPRSDLGYFSYRSLLDVFDAASQPTMSAHPENEDAPPALLNRACLQCRSKKTKCDMSRPRCGLCTRTGSSCEFPTKRKRPCMPDTKRRTRARRDEHHLMLLARLLEEHPGVLEQATMTLAENASPLQQSAASTHSVSSGDPEFSFNHDFVDCDMLGAPSVPHSDIQRSEGPGGEACSPSSSMAETRAVISHDLALHLVEVFFDKVAPWLPLLHQPRFLQHCANVLAPGPDALANATPEDVFTLLGIFALAARYSTLDYHWAVPLQEREQIYLQEAREVYKSKALRKSRVSVICRVASSLLPTFTPPACRSKAVYW